jgi:trk system potassium uptake protein TrkH
MSSTGADYINVAATPVAAKIIFILIGLVGGCTFSMAGGIRIQKIHFLIDSLRKKGKRTDREELKIVIISIASFFIALFILSLIFSTIGIPFIDAVFEVGSAITTNGISMGITTVTIPLMYKWLLIFAMAIGRIEILVVFRILKSTNIFNIAQRFMRSRVTKKSSFVAHKQKKKIKIKS